MDGTLIGWREGVLLLVGLIAVYVVIMLVKLTRVGRRRTVHPAQESPLIPPKIGDADAWIPPAPDRSGVEPSAGLQFEWDEVAEVLGESVRHPPPIGEAAPRGGGFGEHLAEHLARTETELEVRRLREEIKDLRTELEDLRAERRVSPQYAEAMELSQRGLTAQDVAERLGISLAEAELVHALSRGERDFDVGDEDGAERNADGTGIDATGEYGRDRYGR